MPGVFHANRGKYRNFMRIRLATLVTDPHVGFLHTIEDLGQMSFTVSGIT
jgi:hypothetical protein